MKFTNFERRILKIISFTAIVQGLLWAILSLACIVLYKISHNLDSSNQYVSRLQYELYYRFLKEKGEELSHFVITPPDFSAFMWVYFFISSLWVALSIDQYFAIKSAKNRLPIVISLWSVTVISFSILDVILMGLLARDYSNCNDIVGTDMRATLNATEILASDDMYCYITNGIGFTLAARGFLLWLFNIVSAIVVFSFGIQIHRINYISKAIRIPRVPIYPAHIDAWNHQGNHHQNHQHNKLTPSPQEIPRHFRTQL